MAWTINVKGCRDRANVETIRLLLEDEFHGDDNVFVEVFDEAGNLCPPDTKLAGMVFDRARLMDAAE